MYEEMKKWLKDTINNPIVSILLKYSNLTKIQFESVLIDLATETLSINKLRYEDKAKMRINKVSRGAFNRSLDQARKNIISSIYTVLLLSYVGLFKGPPFEDYETLAEKLREYTSLYNGYNNEGLRVQSNLLYNIERELFEGIQKLSKPERLKLL